MNVTTYNIRKTDTCGTTAEARVETDGVDDSTVSYYIASRTL